MMTKLSYAFLCFNNWPVLRETMESALRLQHSQGEVQWVIVDNSLPEYAENMTENIENFLYEHNLIHCSTHVPGGINRGEGAGMNLCFNECKGEHILFFQDDWKCVVNYPFIDLGIEALSRFDHLFMIQLRKRAWKPYTQQDRNCSIGRVLMRKEDLQVFEMADNGFGNNTFQIKLFNKDKWLSVGEYPTTDTIDWNIWKGSREGSVGEYLYGKKLQSLGYRAAKINDGQFEHLLAENAREKDYVTK